MNKLKEYLWTRPNEWLDKQGSDQFYLLIPAAIPALIINQNAGLIQALLFYATYGFIFSLYRMFWGQPVATIEEYEESEDDYDFTPIFFKSAAREHLYNALESAKLSRQLAAAREDTSEFDYWEIVIQDIENLIENYSE
jgi:hypothetical protein